MRWKNSWFGLREQTWDVLEGQQNETDTTGQEETNSFCKRRSHTFWPKSTQYAYLGETSVLVTSRFCFLVHGAKRPNRRTVVNEQTHSPWRVRWSESRSWRHTSSSATPSGAWRANQTQPDTGAGSLCDMQSCRVLYNNHYKTVTTKRPQTKKNPPNPEHFILLPQVEGSSD